MNKVSAHDAANEVAEDRDFSNKDALTELRRLLLAPEQKQVSDLRKRLEDAELDAEDISRILPEAVVLSANRDRKLITALMPTVAEIVRRSVKKDLKTFVDTLFPVMGPAIRKAIAETLRKMIQSLNEALEKSFSWQGLKWRLEARQTGKPFAEIVLLHNLIYRVDQVFLIHRKSGLMLQHAVAETAFLQDADMISGMLTAIQDFVQDSFETPKTDVLETL